MQKTVETIHKTAMHGHNVSDEAKLLPVKS